jgi:hypothetical protein
LDNHNFGFNLPTVQNTRNLIQSIEIYQVHAGLFNQVTLVNPRIAAFTHDTLNYATSDKTLEITMTFDYEYAYYTIQNLTLGDDGPNNSSSLDFFKHGDFADRSNVAYTNGKQTRNSIYQSNNPAVTGYEPALYNSINNVQTDVITITNNFPPSKSSGASTSSLSGLVDISPSQQVAQSTPVIQTRSFTSTATPSTTMYQDVDRTGNSAIG